MTLASLLVSMLLWKYSLGWQYLQTCSDFSLMGVNNGTLREMSARTARPQAMGTEEKSGTEERVIYSELNKDWGTSHLSACVWQLDILGGSSYINGSPHENVQVVHFRIFLFVDKISKYIKEVRNVLGGGKWLPGGQPPRGHTSRNVLFHNLERKITEALLSSPRSGHLMFTHFTLTLQFWGEKEEQSLKCKGLRKTFPPFSVKYS